MIQLLLSRISLVFPGDFPCFSKGVFVVFHRVLKEDFQTGFVVFGEGFGAFGCVCVCVLGFSGSFKMVLEAFFPMVFVVLAGWVVSRGLWE